MAAVAELDDLAFQALYVRYADAAMGLARVVARPPVRPEDVVQDAFLTIWRSAGRYDARRGPVRPWLLGVVRHRAIDALRRVATRREHGEDPEPFLSAVVSGALPETSALHNEDARTIRHALDQLPDAQREAVELAYFGGLTHAEIADRTGAPLGTVKGRMRLALLKLRDLLDGWTEASR